MTLTETAEFVQGADLPSLALTLQDSTGTLIDLSTGWTFTLKIGKRGQAAVVEKVSGFTGGAGAPNMTIAWDSSTDLDALAAGVHLADLTATNGSGKQRKWQFHIRMTAGVGVFVPPDVGEDGPLPLLSVDLGVTGALIDLAFLAPYPKVIRLTLGANGVASPSGLVAGIPGQVLVTVYQPTGVDYPVGGYTLDWDGVATDQGNPLPLYTGEGQTSRYALTSDDGVTVWADFIGGNYSAPA